MRRLWTFVFLGPALNGIFAVAIVMPLVSVFLGQGVKLVDSVVLPFALAFFAFAALPPSLLCFGMDAFLARAKVEVMSRVLSCAVLGFLAGLTLPGLLVLIGYPRDQLLLLFGALGGLSSAACSWFSARSDRSAA